MSEIENADRERESVTEQWRRLTDEIGDFHNDEPPKNTVQRQLMYKQDKVSDLLREIRDGWSEQRSQHTDRGPTDTNKQ